MLIRLQGSNTEGFVSVGGCADYDAVNFRIGENWNILVSTKIRPFWTHLCQIRQVREPRTEGHTSPLLPQHAIL